MLDELTLAVRGILDSHKRDHPKEYYETLEKVVSNDYDGLEPIHKYCKATLLSYMGASKNNPTDLEEAAIILDNLAKDHDDVQMNYVIALNHYFAERYSESQDALNKVKQEYQLSDVDRELSRNLNRQIQEMRSEVAALENKPKRSYILNYENNKTLEKALQQEDSEVILLVDQIKHLKKIKRNFGDQIYTVETEKDIHETYDPSKKLRVVLKHNNNGIASKGINMGIRKARQKDRNNIYEFGEEARSLAEHISSQPQLSRLFPEKRHIAYFCTTKDNTHGVPVVMNNIASRLEKNRNFDVSYIINDFDGQNIHFTHNNKEHNFSNREEFTRFLEDNDIRIDILHSHTWHLSDYYKPFHTDRDQMDLPTFLKRLGNPKLVYTNHANPTEDLRRMKETKANYLVLSEREKEEFLHAHLLDYVSWQKGGWVPTTILAKRQMMELSDLVTFVSETQRQEEKEMIPHLDIDGKSKVVMNGTDIGDSKDLNPERLRQSLGLEGQKVLLYAGRMDEEKGIYDFAQAANLLQRENVSLVYLGNASSDTQSKIKSLAPDSNIVFPGRIADRNELASYYSLADLVVQPTWGECFNQVIAEALAVGTPGVVTDFSGPEEVYVKTGAALGSKVRDPEDLSIKIEEMLSNPSLYEEIAAKGKQLVDKKLNAKSMYQNYLRLYSKVLNH